MGISSGKGLLLIAQRYLREKRETILARRGYISMKSVPASSTFPLPAPTGISSASSHDYNFYNSRSKPTSPSISTKPRIAPLVQALRTHGLLHAAIETTSRACEWSSATWAMSLLFCYGGARRRCVRGWQTDGVFLFRGNTVATSQQPSRMRRQTGRSLVISCSN